MTRGSRIPGEMLGKKGMVLVTGSVRPGPTAVHDPGLRISNTGKALRDRHPGKTVVYYQGSASEGGRFGRQDWPKSWPRARSADHAWITAAQRRVCRASHRARPAGW